MFDLLVFIAALAFIVLGVSLAVSIPIGHVLRSRTDNLPVLIDGVWHHSWCNKAVNPTYICICQPGPLSEMELALAEWNDLDTTTYEDRLTLVSYMRGCPQVTYFNTGAWTVDSQGVCVRGS